jgi:heme a synthase
MNFMQPAPAHARAIARWLMVCICLVVFMVFIGGVTRLTESGLSIVEWKLFSGTLPPLNETAWAAEFDEYKATPQFQKVNAHFTVSDFKKIYWLEYVHRLLGRVIGLAVLLPFLCFAARRQLPRRLFWRWVMVSSGLTDQPRVAPIKLAAHLLLAFGVFCLMLWTRWQVLGHARGSNNSSPSFARGVRVVLAVVIAQIFFGALVAGLRAGLSYNTYPLMDGQWIPTGLHLMQPWWVNHLESVLTVQFQHRMGALAVIAAIITLVWCGRKYAALHHSLKALLAVIFVQFSLGVGTLLSVLNIWLASAHQVVALALLTILLRLIFLCPLHQNQHDAKNLL